MKFASFLSTLTALCLTSAATYAQNGAVAFKQKQDGQLEVLIDGKIFGVYNSGKQWNKPFLYPVHAADGTNILRPIIATAADQGSSKTGNDHFHHKGVWIAVDSVNDERLNFWSEKDKIVNQDVTHSVAENGSGQIVISNTWMQDDKPLLNETTTATFYPSRLATWHIQLAAVDKDVTIYDTKEGFFAVRIAHTMRETEGGRITNAEGLKGEKECWGKPSPWIDYVGEIDGRTYGVTLMDHPDNFRKSRYHVRSYGLFSISPFGPKTYSNKQEAESPVTLSPGKDSLKLTYGMYVHNGETEVGGVANAYQQFLEVTK
ncbi:MAG: PmoA family protein [Planctomycetaceae bacterium]